MTCLFPVWVMLQCRLCPPGGAKQNVQGSDRINLPEQSLLNKWISLIFELFQSAGIPSRPVYSCFPWHYHSWLGQAAGLTHNGWFGALQLPSVTRGALWTSVRALGIYSWCGWVEGPWQPRWSVCCLRAASSLCWLCPLQVSWRTLMVCAKHFTMAFFS